MEDREDNGMFQCSKTCASVAGKFRELCRHRAGTGNQGLIGELRMFPIADMPRETLSNLLFWLCYMSGPGEGRVDEKRENLCFLPEGPGV